VHHRPWTYWLQRISLWGSFSRIQVERLKDKSATLTAFGANVRRLRKILGVSQEALADKAELDRAYLSGVERGVRNVSLINICKIANALEVPPAKLMNF
jgi:DNA-binding XRE family transcriptional regulator